MNDDKIITNEYGKEINLSELDRKFGSYEYEGHTYYGTRQMEPTSSLFPGCYFDAEEGEEFTSEYSAPGYDEEGKEVVIYMYFTEVKGAEVDSEDLDWYRDADRVEYIW